MEHHLRPLLIITVLAILLAGAGYMLWPQATKAPLMQGGLQATSTVAQGNKNPSNAWFDTQDNNHFYLNGQIVLGQSGLPLQKLDDSFATDGTYVYGYYSSVLDLNSNSVSPLVGVDAKTFKLHCAVPGVSDHSPGISNDFACDAAHLVERGLAAVVEGNYDLSTLQKYPDPSPYFKDKNSVYLLYHATYLGVVQGADVSSFEPVAGKTTYDAQDKNHKYLQGQAVQ